MSSPDSARTLLCVDDNATALDVRVALLEFHGYRVFSLTSELETLSFLDQQPVDAVILDYLMPDIKGDKLSLKIRERHPDLIVVNQVGREGTGFGSETNDAMILSSTGEDVPLRTWTKRELADAILDRLGKLVAQRE